MCYKDSDEKGQEMKNCHMFIKTSIEPRDINLYKLTVDNSIDREISSRKLMQGDQIYSDHLSLNFHQSDSKEFSLRLSINDKEFNDEKMFEFKMRYWPSYCNNFDGEGRNSGAYDFRPIDNLFESLPYGELVDAKIQKGSFMSKMTFYFEKFDRKSNEMSFKAIVHVTVDQDLDVIKFDVDLNSLPKLFLDGYEFVATFDAIDFDNNKTFYTDSNGLEM